MALHKEIFRAYDVRGIVDDTFFEEDVYQIGRAFGEMLKNHDENTVIVARDGRLSSPRFHAILLQSLQDSGCQIIDIGIVPTPVLYFATHHFNCPNGIMLTASHNPANYNGLKMVLKKAPLMPDEIAHLYEMALKHYPKSPNPLVIQTADALSAYQARIVDDIKIVKPLKIVIDCANAVSSVIAPSLFRALGCEVILLFCEMDGHFPNHPPDPSEIENLDDLINAVKTHRADVGFAFDGDADRVMVIDNTGTLIFPDYLLMLFTQALHEHHPKFKVLHDVKCTRYLKEAVENLGCTAMMIRTGHSFMKMHLRKEPDALIGAEASGHFFWKNRWYGVDDGIYTAARLLEILSQSEKTLAALMEPFPRGVETPEYKLTICEDKKQAFMQTFLNNARFPNAALVTIDGLRVEFNHGWGLVRVSNTSPNLTFRFEADTKEDLRDIIDLFRGELLKLDAQLVLPF